MEDLDLIKFGEIRRHICQKDPKKKEKKNTGHIRHRRGQEREERWDLALMLKLDKSWS